MPVVSDTVKLHFFKAQSEALQAADQARDASDAARQKQTALQAAIEEVKTVCGKDFQPSVNATGDLVCVAAGPTK